SDVYKRQAPPTGGPFSIRYLGAGRPSLGGDNRAVFQLLLDETAAELAEKCLEAPDLPLVAIYRLTFAALRPSYGVRIEADWSKVYHSLENKARANAWIIAADAERMVEETLTDQNIRVTTDIFGTGEGARGAAERARKQLIDWVLERFFVAQADPASATANSIGKVIDDTVWSVVRSVLPGVGYRLRDREDRELKLLSARMEESVAEVREVIPQGTLGGMLQRYRVDERGEVREDWPARRAKLLSQVNLEGFPRLEVQVGVEDRFETDGLAQVQVDLERRDASGASRDPQSFVFRSAADRKAYVVNLLGAAPGDLRAPFRYRASISFDPTGPLGQRPVLESGWREGNVTELYVEPRSVYRIQEVTVAATPTFSFGPFPAVTAELRYRDALGGEQHGRVELAADRSRGAWRYAIFGERIEPYEYRLTYHRDATAGGPIETPWQSAIDEWLSVPDPMPVKRVLNLFTSLPWADLSVAFVQIRYDDPVHGVKFEEQIDLAADKPFLRRDYPIHADGPRTLRYRLTLLFTNGSLLEGSWRETDDDRLVLDRRLVDTRRITVRALGGSLAENRLASVEVELSAVVPGAAGDGAAERQSTKLRIEPGKEAEAQAWDYLLGDPPARTIRARATFIDGNGFVTEPAITTESDLLVVQLRSKSLSA
ncbi:MAG: hypothetical protein QUU85_17140, partial [Candidatus Eisenbacteria bacterium]|nr:hypothetical protein [Candidatus Eisenbacteria bacterium]